MDKNKNYYKTLGLLSNSTDKEIKKSYYKLSFEHHPDQSKNSDTTTFNLISEAYKVLSNVINREEYDKKSKWGNNFDEYYELLDINIEFDYEDGKQKREDFIKNNINNIQIEVNKEFDGTLLYERWVKCKSCDGSGKDLTSKIVIRDTDGNIKKIFESENGCDFCDGMGKDYRGETCSFCMGKGKIGATNCEKCKGEKRILGKQRLKNIKLTGDKTKVESMGNFSKDGKVGHLLLIKEEKII